MRKSIIKIIFFIILIAMIIVIPSLYLKVSTMKVLEYSKDITILIDNKGKINITDKTIIPDDNRGQYFTIPQCLYINNGKTLKSLKNPGEITVKVDGKKIDFKGSGKTYSLERNGVKLYNIRGGSEIEINYELDAADVVKEYSNVSVLRVIKMNKISTSNIKIKLPEETSIFELKPNADTKYLGNNTYNIKGKLNNQYAEIVIDKEVIKNAQKINQEYEMSDIKRTLLLEDENIVNILLFFATITVIIFIITLVLTRKVKKDRYKYVRNPEEVIEPILAESIIDRKIGAKELIMSCIVELIYRGNLQNIGNDKVQLMTYECISTYEQYILDLFYKEIGQIVTFDEIRKMFIEDNKKTQQLFEKFKIIKKKIEEKLFNYNIYSKTGDKILKISKMISWVILINMIYILYVIVNPLKQLIFADMCMFNIIAIAIAIGIANFNVDFTKKYRKEIKLEIGNTKLKISLIILFICMVGLISYQWFNHLGAILILTIIFIFNFIILIRSKSHVFTKTGKIEFARVQGLKNYIIDYSLMKERELDSVIVWDEYLAYAVAFGIPNKITDKFNENLMNTNIVLQKLENILKI